MDLSANCWILTLRIPILECAQHKPDTFSFPQFVNLAISGRNRRVLLLSSHVPVLEHTQYLPTTVFGDSDLPKWCTDEKLHVGEGRLCRWDGPATSCSAVGMALLLLVPRFGLGLTVGRLCHGVESVASFPYVEFLRAVMTIWHYSPLQIFASRGVKLVSTCSRGFSTFTPLQIFSFYEQ